MVSLFRSSDWILGGVSKNDGIGVENNDSISTTAITFVVVVVVFEKSQAEWVAKSTRI